MDNVLTQPSREADPPFDTARVTAALDALAEQHAGREDTFREAMAQLLKGELVAARAAAQAAICASLEGTNHPSTSMTVIAAVG